MFLSASTWASDRAATGHLARAARHQARRGRAQRKESYDSALARLAAKQQTMPVIEQAKGIIMAQQ